jgi:hypothetical protein
LIFNQKLNIMRLLKMFFVLMIAAMAIGLSSCAKEEVSPPVVDADASEMIYANASGEREDDPDEDCRCEFRVIQLDSITSDTFDLWSFGNFTGMSFPDPEIDFAGNFWIDGSNVKTVLPTDFFDLSTAGSFVFGVADPFGVLTEAGKIRIEVRCFRQVDGGSEVLATTTYHQFNLSEATEDPQGGAFYFDTIELSCLDQNGGTGVSGP